MTSQVIIRKDLYVIMTNKTLGSVEFHIYGIYTFRMNVNSVQYAIIDSFQYDVYTFYDMEHVWGSATI